MTDQRHHTHKHPKVTTTQQDSGSLCTCAYRTQRSDCIRDELDGGSGNALVRGEQHTGVRRDWDKVPSGRVDVAVVCQLQNDPHNREHMRDEWCLADGIQHPHNGASSPTSLNLTSVKRKNTVSTQSNHNTIRDALLPYIARNLLLAKLAPFIGSFTNSQSESKFRNETKKMDVIVSPKKHRSRPEEDGSAGRHRHHRRHHRTEHKSDGELEKERVRAKIRGGEKERSTGTRMERSSSDRGKAKDKAPTSSSERTRRVEMDEEKEERRRRRRERKEAEAFAAGLSRLETDTTFPESPKGYRSHRRDSERRGSRKENRSESDRDGNSSPKSDKDKQLILARKEKESSKVSTRETLRPHISSSSRRAESKQRVREPEKSSEHIKSSEKEKSRDSSSDKSKNSFLGIVLEKKDKMVQCVSCLSDDIPANQAAKLSCNHNFCEECLNRIFTLSLTDPALMPPRCCTTDNIPLKHVDRLLSYKTKRQWSRKYSEYTTANRVYCPTKDCGHWISPRHIEAKIGTCSRCKTKVCTMCNGKAHGSSECPQDEDTKVFIQTAKENGYQKCYECKAVVELKSGCNHITCRCTAEFCYRCGDKWKTCDCPWFAYPDSEEDEDEQENQAAPARIEEENAEARRERRRREQREQIREQRAEEERRNREAQIAADEALARRLAQASLFSKESLDKLDGSGSLRTGLRNSYKKLAEEYAEASKRDEEAREERVRDRLQKLRDRDEAIRSARRGSTSSHREPRSPTVRHERRHSEPRPLTSRGSHSRPSTAQPTPSPPTRDSPEDNSVHHGLFDDDRAARIAKYIMGELDELEPTVQLPSPVEKLSGSSSPRNRPHMERTRRATLSAVEPRASRKPVEHGQDRRPSHHHHTSKTTTASVLPRTLPRLETPTYAASSVLADVAFPLENEKPSRRSSSNTRAGKIRDIHINTSVKSAPTSPLHSSPTSALDSTSSRRSYLADLGYKFLKHHQQVPAPHSAYPLNYTSAGAPAPAYTTYTYSSYSGFGAGTGESGRARQFTQNWGGIDAMGSTWKETFADRLELASNVPRVGVSRSGSY